MLAYVTRRGIRYAAYRFDQERSAVGAEMAEGTATPSILPECPGIAHLVDKHSERTTYTCALLHAAACR